MQMVGYTAVETYIGVKGINGASYPDNLEPGHRVILLAKFNDPTWGWYLVGLARINEMYPVSVKVDPNFIELPLGRWEDLPEVDTTLE